MSSIFSLRHSDQLTSDPHWIIPAWQHHHRVVIVHDTDIRITIQHELGASSTIRVLVITQHQPAQVQVINHLDADDTTTDVHILALLHHQHPVEIDGQIIIAPNVHRVTGRLLETNLLLGASTVRLRTLPLLDVRSSDVSASHGAQIARLDPLQIFYLTAKWLPPSDAKDLIVRGMITDLLTGTDADVLLSIVDSSMEILAPSLLS